MSGWIAAAMAAVLAAVFGIRLAVMRRALRDIARQTERFLESDSNVTLSLSCGDRSLRRFVAQLDRLLRRLRRKYLQYSDGDRELKNSIINLSHDIRTPLTAVCGYLDLLQREPLSDSARDTVNILRSRVEELRRLSESLFRYTLVYGDQPAEPVQTVCLNQQLTELLLAFYGAFAEHGMTPDIVLCDEKIMAEIIPGDFNRVVSNLITNALRYSSGDFRAVLQSDGVICFSNHTKTLDRVTLERLFDRYYTVTYNREGTGIGLSVARILTERMGGTLTADCEGTLLTFRLRVPLTPQGQV